MAGRLLLIPSPLDFGVAGAGSDLRDSLPLGVIREAARLRHWVAENAKTARALLKRVDAVEPLGCSLQDVEIVELPRQAKGRSGPPPDLTPLLGPALSGADLGLMSEAGLPAVADPGAALVQAAHARGIEVVALPGASSLVLALAASGLNGQNFAFVGYLPTDAAERASRIRDLEALSRRAGQTQLIIETPYRNPALLAALLEHLAPGTRLSVSCAVTLPGGFTRTDTVGRWRGSQTVLPADRPAVFSILAG